MTTGWLGRSKVWSPNPSAINTITFCSPPFASTTTSWLKMGVACCLAHFESAAILMGVGWGALPSNLTVPLRVAVPVVLLAEARGLPAFTAVWLHMQIIAVKLAAKITLFV